MPVFAAWPMLLVPLSSSFPPSFRRVNKTASCAVCKICTALSFVEGADRSTTAQSEVAFRSMTGLLVVLIKLDIGLEVISHSTKVHKQKENEKGGAEYRTSCIPLCPKSEARPWL